MGKPVRRPMQAEEPVKRWTIPGVVDVVAGIDPGFGKGGVAVLERPKGGKLRVLHAQSFETKKAAKKQRTNLRVTDDDQRRYGEIYDFLESVLGQYSPHAVGVEGYRVFQGRGGNAWKTAVVFGGIIFWARCRGLYLAPFLPSDLKKEFCGKQSASKTDVEEALCLRVDGLKEALQTIPKTKREHVADAAGHAVLILSEIDQHRKMLGI